MKREYNSRAGKEGAQGRGTGRQRGGNWAGARMKCHLWEGGRIERNGE